jgi:gliding motility-associated-like protein
LLLYITQTIYAAMTSALTRLFLAVIIFFFLSGHLSAQNCFNTGLNGTVINLPCNQNCVNVPVRVPHLKSTSDYIVNAIAYAPFAYVTTGGTEDPDLYDDDTYSNLVNLPFSFCFFDSLYANAVIGSNGLITFDETMATQANAYPITQPIPYAGGTPNVIAPAYYPKASIMGAYSDLDPRPGPTDPVIASPADRKIEWRVEGTAPCRRFIVSFFHIGVFGSSTCGLATPTTFQMVLYESTGIIEVFFENKSCNPSTGSNAILGIQNWARTIGIAAPGKNGTVWQASNEGYRFTPSGGASRFVKCEVFNIGGTIPLAVGDTVTTTAGILDVTFPSFCPVGSGNQYVVKTTFTACDNVANEIVSYDTITINKTNSLNATAAVTPTSCGLAGSGTATVTVPAGIGTAPYTFVLNPGAVTLTGNSPQTFTGLTAGAYTVTVTDASGGCTSIVPATITSTGTLTVTYNITNTSCVGPSNGSITVNPPNGTPPITYSINGGPFTTNNVFSNLAPATYFVSTHDAAGCVADFIPVTVNAGPSITLTYTTTPTSCAGANNGTVTITPSGTAPFQYAINGGPYQSSNTFSNLQATTYFIDVRDAVGCTITFYPVNIPQGTGTVTGTATGAPTACVGVNNGSITVTATSGVGPYQYSLNNGPYQTSNVFNGLAPGTYTITIREAGLCISGPISATVATGSALLATATAANTSCNGATDGTITVSPTNGTAPYTFTLDGTVVQTGTTTTFTGVASGTHSIIVSDAAGCQSAAIPVTVAAGPVLAGTAISAPTACPGVNNGSITVTATNGAAPYTYALDGGAPQTSNVFTGVSAGPHNVIIRTVSGCASANIPVTVNTGSGITATVTPTATACTGISNGTITVTPTNGTAPYTFVLDGTVTLTGATANFTGVGAGTHTITVTDAIGCITTTPLNANVIAGGGFTATYTSINSSCTGATNGSITVTPGAGGSSPYTFVLGATAQTGAANTTFTNLASGTYSVLITDANGCQFTLNGATVTASTGFTATYTSTNSSCTGATNGSITVTPGTGGASPYTFVLGTTTQTGAANTTFTNLTSGTYSVLVTDANGCQFTLNGATVTASTGFTATYTSTNSSCAGATNGSITVTPGTGGASPYTFVLGTTTQTGAANTTFTNLTSGTYSVLVTDANGCQFTLNGATVTASTGFTATYTSTNTTCTGAANGSITVTPGAGGASPYTFVLGATTQTGAANTTFANLASGTYSVLVTDANGCQFTLNGATVTAGPPLNVPVTLTNTTCPGVNNGIVVATPSNGNGPYTFLLDGAISQTGATSTAFNNVAAGPHTMLVTDANGCSITLPSFTIGTGTGVTATINPQGTSCIGAVNGSIAITPTNGTSPYTFVLNGATSQTGAISTSFGNLAAGGPYSIVVTDAIGCTGTFSNINIPQGSALMVNTATVSTTCNTASNGQLTVTPPNGAGPYTFVLNGTITQTGATNTVFTNLTANTYSVVVTDAAGCVSSPISATINPGAPITVAPAKTDAACFSTPTGAISAVASANATAPVEFSLDNTTWQTNPNFAGLASNTYTVYIRDAAGCTNSANINVGQPLQLSGSTAVKNVLCNNQNNGTIKVTATGGTPGYTYSLDNITFQTADTFAVAAGSYNVYIKDARNCVSAPVPVNVTEPNMLTATAIAANATCDGGSDGTITVTPAGGVAPYEYAVTGSSFQPANALNMGPGTYDVTVRDINGCSYQVTGVIVGLTNNLTLTPAGNPAPICEGSSIQLQLTTNATEFAWTPAASLSNSTIKNPVARPSSTTPYTVTATLGRCSLTDNILVTVMPAPVPDAGPGENICYGQSYTLQPTGDPSYTYTWTPSTYLSSGTGYSVTSYPDQTTTYTLNVTDNNGCSSLVSDQVTVIVTPPIQVTTFPADTVVSAGQQVPLLAVSAGTFYTWSPATGLNNPNIPNPVATAPMADGATVTYQVTTTTAAGCTGEGYITITVYKGPDIYTPNAFTPNADGRNDQFIPFPVGIKQLSYFRVFNRWGQLLFSTNTLNKGWDGRFTGLEQPGGVYVWMVEGVTMDNKKITKKGTVTLIR